MTGYVYSDEVFPMGLMCPDCQHVFRDGEAYSSVLVAFQDDVPVSRLVCAVCAQGRSS